MHSRPHVHQADEWPLSDELGRALERVISARDRLQVETPHSAGYQSALTAYLQAAVHHLAIMAVAQAQQTEQLSAEIAALRAHVEALTPLVH